MLEDIREGQDHLTTWLRQKIKKALLFHCEIDDGFRRQCLTNRANNASARSSKYIDGSATFMKTKARMSLIRDATLLETFKYTHTLKKNKGRFVDQCSQDHYAQIRSIGIIPVGGCSPNGGNSPAGASGVGGGNDVDDCLDL
ncbi:hypothetical protein Ahy_A03g013709 [Arachis hypogaea]|uniref:Uncharacterized protein n=1 Tax=Arachis hypogaea TaxID=3818 RepID=A0A445DW01_ARAHY|nr:hypothetical protein Ahy_A03g013709 [Arachis hypogaea]